MNFKLQNSKFKMKKNMINTLLLSMAVALMGCSESDKYTYYEGNAAPDATITTTQEALIPPTAAVRRLRHRMKQ